MKPLAIICLMALAACQPAEELASKGPVTPSYKGVETRLLDGDLVNVHVAMTGATSFDDVTQYAECAAAQYTLIRGYGFLRHVRTSTGQDGGRVTADAVYTISPSLPQGLKIIDAEVTVANCATSGIPTV